MNNREFLATMLANDDRKDVIMDLVENTFNRLKHNPLEFEVSKSYERAWPMYLPVMIACPSNNEYHIHHNLVHDLTNIRHDYMKVSS